MNRTRAFTAGLGICVLLAVVDIALLAELGSDNAPPLAVSITGAVLGVITLVGAGLAWQHRRGGSATVIVSRLLSALLGVPVFFVDAPNWSRVLVVAAIALTVAGLAMLVSDTRRPTGAMSR
jgi:hypothetical protein